MLFIIPSQECASFGPYMQQRALAPRPPPKPNQSAALHTRSHFSSHLFIQAVACCFTGTSACFVLFSRLFVFNCDGRGQLISPPLTLSAAHTAAAQCVC